MKHTFLCLSLVKLCYVECNWRESFKNGMNYDFQPPAPHKLVPLRRTIFYFLLQSHLDGIVCMFSTVWLHLLTYCTFFYYYKLSSEVYLQSLSDLISYDILQKIKAWRRTSSSATTVTILSWQLKIKADGMHFCQFLKHYHLKYKTDRPQGLLMLMLSKWK